MRLLALPAVLAGSALLLTACLDVDADITVNSDATATGNMTVAISSEFSGLLGLASGNDLVDQIEQGTLDGAEGVDDLACSPVDREGAVAMNCTFENQAFEEADDLWNIYAGDDGTVTFVTTSGEEVTEEDASLLGDLDFNFGGYDLAVEMPGTITSVEGTNVEQTSDTTFRVQAGLDENFDVVVTSDTGSGGFPTSLIIVLIIAALGIAALVLYFTRRAKKNNGDDTPAIGTEPGPAN
mgnify:FL=1